MAIVLPKLTSVKKMFSWRKDRLSQCFSLSQISDISWRTFWPPNYLLRI